MNTRKIKIPELSHSAQNAKLHQLVYIKLKELNYEAYEECKFYGTPKVNDKNLIPKIIEFAVKEGYSIGSEHQPFLIAVCYLLVAPYKLLGYPIKLPIGYRDILQESLKYANPEMINYMTEYIPPLYKSPKWKAKVHALGDKIFEKLKELELIN